MDNDTVSEQEFETDKRVHWDLSPQVAETLHKLAEDTKCLKAGEQLPGRETRNNLELVCVFERVTGAGLSVGKAAAQRRSARKCYTTRKDLDQGRQVQVLWIPFDFPKNKCVKQHHLHPFRGRVVQHEPGRGSRTHRVLYSDKKLKWHAVDQLKFLD
jgi:hypothetical protein